MTPLFTPKEAAARLKTTADQVMGFVHDGSLKYVNMGRGKIKPRIRFTETDIDEFIDQRRTREEPKCLYSKSRTGRASVTIVGSEAIGLGELRKQKTARTLKKSRRPLATPNAMN